MVSSFLGMPATQCRRFDKDAKQLAGAIEIPNSGQTGQSRQLEDKHALSSASTLPCQCHSRELFTTG